MDVVDFVIIVISFIFTVIYTAADLSKNAAFAKWVFLWVNDLSAVWDTYTNFCATVIKYQALWNINDEKNK